MTDINLTIIGNITRTPVTQYLQSGAAILRITIASTPQYYSKAEQKYVNGETTFMPVELRSSGSQKHNAFIERQTELFKEGDRVIATGKLETRTKQEGDEVRRWNVLILEEIGFSTRFMNTAPQREFTKDEEQSSQTPLERIKQQMASQKEGGLNDRLVMSTPPLQG